MNGASTPGEIVYTSDLYGESQRAFIFHVDRHHLPFVWANAVRGAGSILSILRRCKETTTRFPQIVSIAHKQFNHSLTLQIKSYIPQGLVDAINERPEYLPPKMQEHVLNGGSVPALPGLALASRTAVPWQQRQHAQDPRPGYASGQPAVQPVQQYAAAAGSLHAHGAYASRQVQSRQRLPPARVRQQRQLPALAPVDSGYVTRPYAPRYDYGDGSVAGRMSISTNGTTREIEGKLAGLQLPFDIDEEEEEEEEPRAPVAAADTGAGAYRVAPGWSASGGRNAAAPTPNPGGRGFVHAAGNFSHGAGGRAPVGGSAEEMPRGVFSASTEPIASLTKRARVGQAGMKPPPVVGLPCFKVDFSDALVDQYASQGDLSALVSLQAVAAVSLEDLKAAKVEGMPSVVESLGDKWDDLDNDFAGVTENLGVAYPRDMAMSHVRKQKPALPQAKEVVRVLLREVDFAKRVFQRASENIEAAKAQDERETEARIRALQDGLASRRNDRDRQLEMQRGLLARVGTAKAGVGELESFVKRREEQSDLLERACDSRDSAEWEAISRRALCVLRVSDSIRRKWISDDAVRAVARMLEIEEMNKRVIGGDVGVGVGGDEPTALTDQVYDGGLAHGSAPDDSGARTAGTSAQIGHGRLAAERAAATAALPPKPRPEAYFAAKPAAVAPAVAAPDHSGPVADAMGSKPAAPAVASSPACPPSRDFRFEPPAKSGNGAVAFAPTPATATAKDPSNIQVQAEAMGSNLAATTMPSTTPTPSNFQPATSATVTSAVSGYGLKPSADSAIHLAEKPSAFDQHSVAGSTLVLDDMTLGLSSPAKSTAAENTTTIPLESMPTAPAKRDGLDAAAAPVASTSAAGCLPPA